MSKQQEIEYLLRARCSLIILVTREEPRAEALIREVCERRERPCYAWDVADGFRPLVSENLPIQSGSDALQALEQIRRGPDKAVYVLRDFHDCWEHRAVKRKLRSVVQELTYTKKSVVVITHSARIPEELLDRAEVVEMGLPGEAELEQTLEELLRNPDIKVNLAPEQRTQLIQAALGLTTAQAQRVFAKGIVRNGVLEPRDIDLVTAEKKNIVRNSRALEFYPVKETQASVGGLDALKEWLRIRGRAFSPAARAYGLPAPKGIALIGIPGTGKSLSAKVIGNLWNLPLIRFDVGALFGSYVGESEQRTREALRLAEAVAPCVLWIDELEKALAQGGHESSTSVRVFGTILTWMSEKTAPCFVVATANDISRLPPELLRRGRFDEIFFLDLPNTVERKEIFSVHLSKRGRDPARFDLEALAEAARGYVGAEIEQAVIDAMYLAFAADREFDSNDINTSIERLIPLSVSQRERIQLLRSWLLEGRAQSASFTETDQAQKNFVEAENER